LLTIRPMHLSLFLPLISLPPSRFSRNRRSTALPRWHLHIFPSIHTSTTRRNILPRSTRTTTTRSSSTARSHDYTRAARRPTSDR
jgi:hypothetical protein